MPYQKHNLLWKAELEECHQHRALPTIYAMFSCEVQASQLVTKAQRIYANRLYYVVTITFYFFCFNFWVKTRILFHSHVYIVYDILHVFLYPFMALLVSLFFLVLSYFGLCSCEETKWILCVIVNMVVYGTHFVSVFHSVAAIPICL